MIKVFLLFFLLVFNIFAKGNIDKDIATASGKIKHVSKSYSSINKKMAQNAKEIFKQKKEISKQKKLLATLIKSLKNKELSYKKDSKKLFQLKKEQEKLKLAQEKIEEELIFTIAKSISLTVVLEEKSGASQESLIEIEVIKVMLEKTKNAAKILNKTNNLYIVS